MALEIFMPRLTHDMQRGRLVEWYKGEGEAVEKGEPLFAVETDKATVDVEAEAAGVLRGLQFRAGDEVAVGTVMAWIGAPDEKAPAVRPRLKPAAPAPTGVEEAATPPGGEAAAITSPRAGGRIVASPLARRIAKQYGADLSQITGRGPHGRITQADVQAYLASEEAELLHSKQTYDVVPTSQLRQSTGERLSVSLRTAAHLDLEVEVDMSEAARWQARSAAGGQSEMSYTALLIKIVAQALRHHRHLNAAFVAGELRVYREINIGVEGGGEHRPGRGDAGWGTPDGLWAPVIRRADQMSLRQIQNTLSGLREKAEKGEMDSADVADGTFTLSDLGMYGFDAARAIINPSQVAILTVGRITERPVGKDGQVVLLPTARLVLSVDHRVLDGAAAAPFLTRVRQLLENPYLLL